MKKIIFLPACLFLCGFIPFKKIARGNQITHEAFIQKSFSLPKDQVKDIQKQLNKIAKKYSSQAIEWWILYKKALIFQKDNLELYCYNMQFLSQIQKFPLRHYATLNFYSHCHSEAEIDLSYFPKWLRNTAAKEWYNKAEKTQNKNEILKSSYYMYQISSDKYLRERYLLTAIKLAEQSDLKSFQKTLVKWQKELEILSPRFIKNPTRAQKLEVAHSLRKARKFNKARSYYIELLNSPKASFREKNESFKWLRQIYKSQNKKKKYLIATRQWKDWLKITMKKDPRARGIYHNIFYLLASTQWTLHKTSKALQTLSQMEKELKGKYSLFQVYRIKALIFREKKEFKKAISFFKKALEHSAPDSELKEQTLWDYAWTLRRAGQMETSIAKFTELLNISKSEYLPSRVLFWIGKMYEDMNKKKPAKTVYKQLIDKDPLSYYGLLAHHRLGRKIRINKERDIITKTPKKQDYIIVQWLLSLGEKESALDLLKYKLRQYQKEKNISTKTWSTLFYYMAKSGSYFPLFRTVGRLPLEERTTFFRSYTDLLFPRMYITEIEKATQLSNLEKEIMYALIRQESAWDARARSPADAFGLTQMRPFVARKQARKQGISYRGIEDLYNPEKNILIGTSFFKDLFEKYDSQFIVTVAVYNAGRTPVMHWLKRINSSDSLSFIEDIPYEETKTYVRLLIRNFIFYKLLSHPKRKISFPEWLLHLEASSFQKK